MSRQHRPRALLAVLALVAGACGGGGESDSTDGTADGASDAGGDQTAAEEPADDQPADNGNGDSGDGNGDSGDAADDDSIEPDVPDPSSSPRPDPLALVPFPAGPEPFTDPPSLPTAEEQIGAMFAHVASVVVGDDRGVNGLMLDAFDSRTWQGIPDVVLTVVAARASISAEVFDVIARYSSAGSSAGYGPEATAYFDARQAAASTLATQNQALYDVMVTARGLDLRGRACVASAFADEPDACSFHGAAEALVADLVAVFDTDIELPDEFDDDIGPLVDLCQVWSTAVFPGLGEADELLFDLVADDSVLDTRFIGRSECRFESGVDEDPTPELGPGRAAFEALYSTVAETGGDLDFDEDFYDNAPEDDYLVGAREAVIAHTSAAAASVAANLAGVTEPFARLGLVSIAVVSAEEAWYQAAALERGGAEGVLVDLAVACVDQSADDPFSGCDPDIVPFAEHLLLGGGDDSGFTGYTETIDWEDVEDRYDHCTAWRDAIAGLGPAEAEAVDFQLGQLTLDRPFGLNDCR